MGKIKVRHGDIIQYKRSGDHSEQYCMVVMESSTGGGFRLIMMDHPNFGYEVGSMPKNAKIIANVVDMFSEGKKYYIDKVKHFELEIG